MEKYFIVMLFILLKMTGPCKAASTEFV